MFHHPESSASHFPTHQSLTSKTLISASFQFSAARRSPLLTASPTSSTPPDMLPWGTFSLSGLLLHLVPAISSQVSLSQHRIGPLYADSVMEIDPGMVQEPGNNGSWGAAMASGQPIHA